MEPSWPVFMACRRSNASGPRTSPTMIRPGACAGSSYQIAHGDLAPPSNSAGAFKAHHMGLLQLQLGGILAGDDALVRLDDSPSCN